MFIRHSAILAFPLFAAILIILSPTAFADEEASNSVHVVSATYGTHYAKSIPAENSGTKGQTQIYRVTKDKDELEHTYDWFASQIYLQGTAKGTAVVRLGPWARGHEAGKDDLAIAFYLNGKLLKGYSTLDIAGKPDKVQSSTSHYSVLGKVSGFRWIDSNDYAFDVTGPDDKTISFDISTGEIIPREAARAATVDAAHVKWLVEVMKELQGLKVGITRAELLKVCTTEGGISNRTQRTYVSRQCPYIKLTTHFKPVGNESDLGNERPTDEITELSQPYLEWTIGD